MKMKMATIGVTFALMTSTASAQAIVQCGGDFNAFKQNFANAAAAQGMPANAISAVMAAATPRSDVLKLDRSQSTFKQTFLEFSGRIVSSSRLSIGAQKLGQYANVFAAAEQQYGIPAEVIATFWAAETDFGAVQGNMPTVAALATLAHDCRRPELFQPQLMGAIALTAKGGMNPATQTGAWAGEIGQVQMLPADIVRLGVDGDGDGRVDLQGSAPDAIMSAAKMLNSHGWRTGQPWVQEVKVSGDQAWQHSGLDQKLSTNQWAALGVAGRASHLPNGINASLVAPQGRFGPVFLTYDNYDVFLQWNKSFIYSLSAAYMATRMGGEAAYDRGNPEAGLSVEQTVQLQNRLNQLGYDVGKADGIIGAKTRAAVQKVQAQAGMVPDGWPTPQLMSAF